MAKTGLPGYSDDQLQILNDLDEGLVQRGFAELNPALAGAPRRIVLPNGQELYWSAVTRDGTVTDFAIGFRDTAGQMVAANYSSDGKFKVNMLDRPYGGDGPARFSADAWDKTDLDSSRLPQTPGEPGAATINEARMLMEGTVELLGMTQHVSPVFRDDLDRIDRAMEQSLGAQQPRSLLFPH